MKDNSNALSRRNFLRLGLYNTAGVSVGGLLLLGASGQKAAPRNLSDLEQFDWGYLIDITRCIGCGSCVRACKLENKVPDEYFRTWVERYEIDEDEKVFVDSPNGALESFKGNRVTDKSIVRAFFVPKLCCHCRNSACTQVCPVGATYHSPDGVVLVDKKHCIGCGYCVQACPYGCRYITHSRGTADKCTLCYHRIHKGRTTACVRACPREARLCGNLKDPESPIRKALHRNAHYILKAEMGTNPKCFYLGLDLEVK